MKENTTDFSQKITKVTKLEERPGDRIGNVGRTRSCGAAVKNTANKSIPLPVPEVVTIYAQRSHDNHGNIVLSPLRILAGNEYFTLREAQAVTGLSVRRLSFMCETGKFKTAHKPGGTHTARWRVAREEVFQMFNPPAD